jgi:hypothetical protein
MCMRSRWEIEEQLATSATDIDPEGVDFVSLDNLYAPKDESAKRYMDELYDEEVYGDPVHTDFKMLWLTFGFD